MLLVLVGAGCTAVPALVQCRKAEASLQGLERKVAETTASNGTAGQERSASAPLDPSASYELTLARAYLDKAREEASEAHYGLSIQLAKSSQQASRRARSALVSARAKPAAETGSPRRRL